eukprot:GHVU01222544.1.p2 GENE.GHVU01222544.1~~GHVU01222544.1.p2  ORF type:complete len:167 (-),score=28.21 GHVU01222544.1:344-844(-)
MTAKYVATAMGLLDEFRSLRQALWLNAFDVPVWNPNNSDEQNTNARESFEQKHTSLSLKMASLRRSIEQLLKLRLEGSSSSSGFGHRGAAAVSRYLRAFAELGELNNVETGPSGTTSQAPAPKPVARISLPTRPPWVDASGGGKVHKLWVSEDQMAALHKTIVGVF